MRKINLKSTEDTPHVEYHDGENILRISGRSLPEDAWAFYEPVIEWASVYSPASASSALVIELFLEYFNSSSGRYILELLSTLEKKGIDNVKVVWCAEKDDELMVEKGEEFSSLVDLPFEIKVA
ncbi:MAG: hypothetical protein ACJAU0_002515 [Flavobacteriales bacterium]|jgi:hypothetical protein